MPSLYVPDLHGLLICLRYFYNSCALYYSVSKTVQSVWITRKLFSRKGLLVIHLLTCYSLETWIFALDFYSMNICRHTSWGVKVAESRFLTRIEYKSSSGLLSMLFIGLTRINPWIYRVKIYNIFPNYTNLFI